MALSKEIIESNDDDVDYLTEDPIINTQKYVCISFLKPSNLEESSKFSVSGVKIRGSYETYEQAKKRAEYLQRYDKYHNIYIGEVGKWCPFEDNPEKAKDCEYMNKDLNKLMKSYIEQQDKAKEYHELRKQDMINKAKEETEKKKQSNEEYVENTNIYKKKYNKIDKLQKEIENSKKELEEDKNIINENIIKIRELEEELTEKIKELENITN